MHPVEKAGCPDAANKGASGIDDDKDDDEEDDDEEEDNEEEWEFVSP
jgi:hypothetical protein